MLRPSAFLTRVLRVSLALSAIAIALAVGLPHHHDKTASSHEPSSCRVCKIQEGFSAAPGTATVAPQPVAAVAIECDRPLETSRSIQPHTLHASRAPPTLS